MAETSGVAAAKQALRPLARERRRQAAAAAPEASTRAAAHFMAALAPAAGLVVAVYWPQDEEMDTQPLVTALAAAGCTVALPVIMAKALPLTFRAYAPGDPLNVGRYGIAVPVPEAAIVMPALLAVPLLAFDGAGHRLGNGGGYYDRTLRALRRRPRVEPADYVRPVAVGYAYECQEWPALPGEPLDEALDWIVSEAKARKIA